MCASTQSKDYIVAPKRDASQAQIDALGETLREKVKGANGTVVWLDGVKFFSVKIPAAKSAKEHDAFHAATVNFAASVENDHQDIVNYAEEQGMVTTQSAEDN
ncbi:hypothetical protein LPJ66_010592 [Kickxella alabastrina]|uniref:Uncharacterized protein n=1 Tax=Kickxella alabastrina TaxID=61397 RepID=A0ACC1I028_9FUNG|nr:hypothetical protein LPJ66_010592 [Kickxella alabastrina]